MFERELTCCEDVPVMEKMPPVSELNGESIKMLSEAELILSATISDISGRKREEDTKREPPRCIQDQVAMIVSMAGNVMGMAREIKSMITA